MDPKATEAVTKLKGVSPQTVGDMRQIMYLLGVYQRSIGNLAKIAKLLYDLLNWDKKLKETEKISNLRRRNMGRNCNNQRHSPIQWTQEHADILNVLIE
jgi:hypothetical protein